MQPAIYITYRELFDRLPTTQELKTIVKGLNAFQTVLLTARLNTLFRHSASSVNPLDANAPQSFQYWFATTFFDFATRSLLEKRFGLQNPVRRPGCHPLQFLS